MSICELRQLLVHHEQVDLPGGELIDRMLEFDLSEATLEGGTEVDDVHLATLQLEHPLGVVVDIDELDRVQVRLACLPVVVVGLQRERRRVRGEGADRERPGTDWGGEVVRLALPAEVAGMMPLANTEMSEMNGAQGEERCVTTLSVPDASIEVIA